MKFGKTLISHQIPEWSIFYMNYKNLKKTIKNIDQAINYDTEKVPELVSNVLSEFFFELDREIEKVDAFYNNKFKEYSRRLTTIISVLGFNDDKITHQIESNDELDEIISILLELRTIYRNLKWFGELNHKGFVKILKKLDKKLIFLQKSSNNHLSSSDELIKLPNYNKENYLSTRVNALPFANETELLNGLDVINNILNELGDIEIDNNSLVKKFDFLKVGNRRYSFDQELLQHFYDLIENDDSSNLFIEFKKIPNDKMNLKFLISLLNKSCLTNSINCIDALFTILIDFNQSQNLPFINSLFDQYDISGRNFFHQFIVSSGKAQAVEENKGKLVVPGETMDLKRFYGNKGGPDGVQLTTIKIDGIKHILTKIDDQNLEFKQLLIAKDSYCRTPIHYSAQYGLKDITQLLLEYLYRWELVNQDVSIDNLDVWGDQEGLTPIHLSIIGKHPKTTDNLISYSHTQQLRCPNLLLLAVRLNSQDILQTLLQKGRISVDYTDLQHNNETALYIASKLNYANIVEFLLKENANTEIGELTFGWTPVFIAASEGYEEIVRLLIDHDCMIDSADDSGWLPVEHASLRGHLIVADLLKPEDDQILLHDIYNPSNNVRRLSNSSLKSPSIYSNNSKEELLLSTSSIDKLPESNKVAVNEVYKQLKQLDSNGSSISNGRAKSPSNKKTFKPIKSFGHRYLNSGESLLLITLGTTDLRDNESPIELNKISMAKSFFTELDTALSLRITCRNKSDFQNDLVEPPVIVDLPLEDHHGSATDPVTFKLTNNLKPEDVIISFDIIPTYLYPNTKDMNTIKPNKKSSTVLGRGIALLSNAYTKVGPNLRSLNNKITVPIIETTSLDLLGKLRFEYLCVRSFDHPALNISRSDTYWKQLVSTRVIGHRGLGKNVSNRNSLQLGENTVESFIAAASLGASYVEFDVQLTKDFTAVIYHDFTVAESGVDIPMHSLTAEQFLGLNDHEAHPLKNEKNKKSIQADTPNKNSHYSLDDEILGKVNRPRSMSTYPSAPNFKKISSNDNVNESEDEIDKEVKDQINRRMKLTKTWKDKGFKGNARGSSIASNFVTLKDLFKKLPKNVGFNIELKYPMLDEAEHESMGEIGFDLNFYVDTILKVVYDENTTGRDILFSSFHPDICLLLSLKQPTMPILYLTEAGTNPMADIRASSLQNAIRFAKKWNLLGIVSAAETLVKTPRLAQVVKSSGLVCVTYGVLNNSPEFAKIQMKAGVDAVIADSVLAVREGLRKDQEALKELEDSSTSE